MQTNKIFRFVAMVLFAFVFLAGCAGTKSKSEKDAERDSVRTMTAQSLDQLYQNEPSAKGSIADAAGYAVFSDFGFKVMLMGGAHGQGMAVNNATKDETFMKMVELQPGLGLGAQKYRLILIFENQDTFNNFKTSGWELGTNAMAAAKDRMVVMHPLPRAGETRYHADTDPGAANSRQTENGLHVRMALLAALLGKV